MHGQKNAELTNKEFSEAMQTVGNGLSQLSASAEAAFRDKNDWQRNMGIAFGMGMRDFGQGKAQELPFDQLPDDFRVDAVHWYTMGVKYGRGFQKGAGGDGEWWKKTGQNPYEPEDGK